MRISVFFVYDRNPFSDNELHQIVFCVIIAKFFDMPLF